jgi:hypothetical protein
MRRIRTLTGYILPVANETPKPIVAFDAAIWPHTKQDWQSFNDTPAVRFPNVRALTDGTDWRPIHDQSRERISSNE